MRNVKCILRTYLYVSKLQSWPKLCGTSLKNALHTRSSVCLCNKCVSVNNSYLPPSPPFNVVVWKTFWEQSFNIARWGRGEGEGANIAGIRQKMQLVPHILARIVGIDFIGYNYENCTWIRHFVQDHSGHAASTCYHMKFNLLSHDTQLVIKTWQVDGSGVMSHGLARLSAGHPEMQTGDSELWVRPA